ncbi:MAG: hypothetical protein IPK89_13485 [Sphingomonadales bacterium]|nr:hypothetical protein [Sphingomonadales bacterium]
MLPVDSARGKDPRQSCRRILVGLWEQGYQVVAGALSDRQEGLLMLSTRKIFYQNVNRLSDFEISPDVGVFQLLDRAVMDALQAEARINILIFGA